MVRWLGRLTALVGLVVLCSAVASPAEATPPADAAGSDGGPAVECRGVGWPANYVPVEAPPDLPSDQLGLRGTLVYAETRLPAPDVEALLIEGQTAAGVGQPLRIGLVRDLNLSLNGEWSDLADGGRLWTGAIVSEGALALRLHFREGRLPFGGAVYVCSAQDPTQVVGPYTEAGPRQDGQWWAVTVSGDTARVECVLPPGSAAELPFRIDQLVHVYRELDDGGGLRAGLSCMKDVACYSAWQSISYSVARMLFVEGGDMYLCTGQLLAAQNTDLTPYFLTSAHCISTQTVADTLECRWFYQHTTCNGSTFMTSQYSSAADLLATSGYTGTPVNGDWTLLMIKGALPSTVFWTGWTTGSIATGSYAVGVSHPQGDYKRYSKGRRLSSGGTWWQQITFDQNLGTIDQGSSGSGIWKDGTTPTDQLLYGNCSYGYGATDCDNPTNSVYYGKFSQYYSSISTLLAAGSDDAFESNDTCATATAISSGTYSNLIVKKYGTSGQNGEDWYKVTLGNGDRLRATLAFTNSYGNIDAQLYNSCGGSVVASGTGTSNTETVTYTNPGAAATFYLRVYLANDTRNNYSLTVSGAYVDCNTNGLDDACDVSCASPGCSVPGCGLSPDCNGNGNPDECDLSGNDCNVNGVPDDCDAAALISVDPSPVTSCPGTEVQFSVTASEPGAAYQWKLENSPVTDGGRISGATTSTLTIADVEAADAGNYTCEVTSGCIVVDSAPALLTVRMAVDITGQPSNRAVCLGAQASFSVTASGSEPVHYEWRKNGAAFGAPDSATLVLTGVTHADDATYTCYVSNACGGELSNAATLDVAGAQFTRHPRNTCGPVGSTIVLTADAAADTAIYWAWKKNNGIMSGQNTSTLTLSNVQLSDAASYKAVAATYSPITCIMESNVAVVTVSSDCPCYTPGDMDNDGDFDLADMSAFTLCFGPGGALTPGCVCANVDGDPSDNVDLTDWAALEALIAGPSW